MSYLYELIDYMDTPNKSERIIGGDFNINFKSNNILTTELKKLLAKKALRQIITQPTRTAAQPSMIDLIRTDSDYIKRSGVLDINMSDHLPVFILRKKVKTPKCAFVVVPIDGIIRKYFLIG